MKDKTATLVKLRNGERVALVNITAIASISPNGDGVFIRLHGGEYRYDRHPLHWWETQIPEITIRGEN